MASRYHRLLDLRKLAANMVQSRDQVFDAGAYRVLEIDCRVPVLGSAGTVKVQHAAVTRKMRGVISRRLRYPAGALVASCRSTTSCATCDGRRMRTWPETPKP